MEGTNIHTQSQSSTESEALNQLFSEVQKGMQSAKEEGWISEEDAYRLLGFSR